MVDLFAAEHSEGIVRGPLLDAHRAAEGGIAMSKICGNSVCNKDQGTGGCVSAEWCPYFISTEPSVARTETIVLPRSKWMATNRIEPPKEEADGNK